MLFTLLISGGVYSDLLFIPSHVDRGEQQPGEEGPRGQVQPDVGAGEAGEGGRGEQETLGRGHGHHRPGGTGNIHRGAIFIKHLRENLRKVKLSVHCIFFPEYLKYNLRRRIQN